MRVRRLLYLWCTALVVAGVGGLGGFGVSARALQLVGPPPGAAAPDVHQPTTTGAPPTPAMLKAAARGSAPTSPVAGPTSTAATPGPPPSAPPGALMPHVVTGPTTTVVPPDAHGFLPCTVHAEEGQTSRLSTAVATVRSPGNAPLVIENCRPITGDVVAVNGSHPFAVLQVDFGDGTVVGRSTPGCPFPATGNPVEEHRYAKPGRYLLESTWRFCAPTPPVVFRVWIEVSDGRVPEVAGAAPCRGTGPVKPGEPARQGVGKRVVETRIGPEEVRVVRCSVAPGQQSEAFLWWYEAAAVVDWGDGSRPQTIGGAGQQGASALHAYAARGLYLVAVRVLGGDGTPGAPATFSVLVS